MDSGHLNPGGTWQNLHFPGEETRQSSDIKHIYLQRFTSTQSIRKEVETRSKAGERKWRQGVEKEKGSGDKDVEQKKGSEDKE